MSLITETQAAELSAPLSYVKVAPTTEHSKRAWMVWVKGSENSGPHAMVERTYGGYRGRRVSCASVGTHHGKWLGVCKSRKLAAHAALVAVSEPLRAAA